MRFCESQQYQLKPCAGFSLAITALIAKGKQTAKWTAFLFIYRKENAALFRGLPRQKW